MPPEARVQDALNGMTFLEIELYKLSLELVRLEV
jgi:hypothetical protein